MVVELRLPAEVMDALDFEAESGAGTARGASEISIELDLPPNVPSQKIIDAPTQALQAEQSDAE